MQRRIVRGFGFATLLLVSCVGVEFVSIRELSQTLARADRLRRLLDVRDEFEVLGLGSADEGVRLREFGLARQLAEGDHELLTALDDLEGQSPDSPTAVAVRRGILERIAAREHELMGQRLARMDGRMRVVWLAALLGTFLGLGTAGWYFVQLLGLYRAQRAAEALARSHELQLATTLDNLADAVLSLDPTGRLVRLNPVALRLAGRPLSEVEGRPIAEALAIEDESGVAAWPGCLEKVFGERRPFTMAAARLRGAGSSEGPTPVLAVTASPLCEGARATGAVVVLRDVTLERRARVELQQMNDALEERVLERTAELDAANGRLAREHEERERAAEDLHEATLQLRQAQKVEALGKLAAGVAHDFNNALCVILSTSELLLEDVPPGTSWRAELASIHQAGRHAADLTRRLLAFSRKQVLSPRLVNVNHVIEGMVGLLRRVLAEGVTIDTALGPDVGSIRVDPGQLEQVLVNLAVNARDAMPAGGTLTISTEEVDSPRHGSWSIPGWHVALAIKDTGTGIAPDLRDRIFEPFFTTKAEGQGSGLGLATVQGIVEQSGGAIDVDSELGVGTTFRLYFPCATGVSMPTSRQETSPDATVTATGETILVVEDQPAVRGIIAAVLARAGYQTLAPASPSEAIGLASRLAGQLDLVLVDAALPGGVELLSRLRDRHPELRAIFMGQLDDRRRTALEGTGAVLLQKPVEVEPLRRLVREVLKSGEARREAPVGNG